MVGEVIELFHKIPDLFLIEFREVARPVVLIAQSPDDDGGVVIMLADHVGHHPAGLVFI